MDSVSQFALGAAVGVGVMGRRVPVWRAALWGGVCGTLPDLDSFIDHGDPVSNMTMHRAETHAIFWQTLAAPPIGAAIAWLHRAREPLRANLGRWCLAVWLVLVTHALLDAMTVYGTQLALPFTDTPYGVGSVFIIDPLYTLALVLGLVAALRSPPRRALGWNAAGLAVSTAYLAWSVVAQWQVEAVVRATLARSGGPPPLAVLVTPTPFNTVLWRVLVMREHHYDEGFRSLLDEGDAIRWDRFPRDAALRAQAAHLPALARIAWFSEGFYKVRERDGRVVVSDLRMGIEPAYTFEFAVGTRASAIAPIRPEYVGGLTGIDPGATIRWLALRALGHDLPVPRPG